MVAATTAPLELRPRGMVAASPGTRMEVSASAPQKGEGQSRGVLSMTERAGMLTPVEVRICRYNIS
jgi:hypothetical protein